VETAQTDLQVVTRGGQPWQPSYLLAIDPEKCIGCGRCFKVCGQGVMTLKGITEDGDLVDLEEDDEIERKIMSVTDPAACIGCSACSRVCPKACQSHGPA
jgi:Nif-specific ferredoxin III